MRGTLEKQLELEMEMLSGGIQRFRKARDQAINSKAESRTLHGRVIVSRIVEAVAAGVRQVQTEAKSNRDITSKKIRHMDSEQVAYLSCVSMVDCLSRRNALLAVAHYIGGNIEMQDRLDKWVAIEGMPALRVIALANEKGQTSRRYGLTHKMNKDGYEHTAWTKQERIHVGVRMVDVIIQHTGIIQLEKQVLSTNKTVTTVRPTQSTEDWIKAFNEYSEVARPRYAPCIIPPKDWNDIHGGGYHGTLINELPIVRRK